eukprot:6201570-Pleurochrysis_carterae.AAC.4
MNISSILIILIYDVSTASSELHTCYNVTTLAKVNIEEYYLAVNSNLDIGGLCTLLVTHGCVFDLFSTSTSSTQPCPIHT